MRAAYSCASAFAMTVGALAAPLAAHAWEPTKTVEFVKAKPMIAGLSLELLAGGVGVAIVVALGKWLAKRQEAAAATQRPAEISK